MTYPIPTPATPPPLDPPPEGTVVVHTQDHRGMTTSRCPRCGTQFVYWDEDDLDDNGDLRCYCS